MDNNSPLNHIKLDDNSPPNHVVLDDNNSPPTKIENSGRNSWFNSERPPSSNQSEITHNSQIMNPSSLLDRKKTLNKISMRETNDIVVDEIEYNDCCEVSSCCQKFVKFEVDSFAIIKILPISPFRKELLRRRYSDSIGDYQQVRDCTRIIYRLFQIIIAMGGIIVPALLSVLMTEYVQDNGYDIQINIMVLILSIIVSICTTAIHIFKLDELYYVYGLTVEKLKTLWVSYTSLSGPFVGSTHNQSFTLFIEMMENIIINQKFQEYIDSKGDKNKSKDDQEQFYRNLSEYNDNNYDYYNDDNDDEIEKII